MPKALHPTEIWSDALAKLSEVVPEMAAPDADAIRCTGDFCLFDARYQAVGQASC